MRGAVVAVALAVAAVNVLPALAGAWEWHRGGQGRAFWVLLRVAQAAAIALAVWVGVLAATGRYASEGLFYLYALLPIAVGFVAEQLRVTAAQVILDRRGLDGSRAVGKLPEPEQHAIVAAIVRREIGVMALSALVVVFLALRAAATAHGF